MNTLKQDHGSGNTDLWDRMDVAVGAVQMVEIRENDLGSGRSGRRSTWRRWWLACCASPTLVKFVGSRFFIEAAEECSTPALCTFARTPARPDCLSVRASLLVYSDASSLKVWRNACFHTLCKPTRTRARLDRPSDRLSQRAVFAPRYPCPA